MFKILKYLKKTWVSVLIIILLLCVQAWADLTLPDYTSKIVNTGIQAGGIEYVAPEVIRKSQMDNLLLFTEDDEEILSNYTLISKSNLQGEEYEKIKEEYPEIENQDLYELNKLNNSQKERLDEIITKPFMAIYFIENEQTSNKIKEEITKNVPEQQKNIIQQMPLTDIIKSLPEEQLSGLKDEINKQLDQSMGTVLDQAAVQATKAEYIAIGVNTDSIQNGYILKVGFQMIGIALISMTSAVIIMLLSSRVAANLGKTLRDKVFKKVLTFTRKEFNEFSTASLITRSTNDIQQIQMLLTMLFRVVVYAPIIGIGGFLRVLAHSNNSMAWIIGLAIACVIIIVLVLFIVAMPKFKKLQDLIDKLNLVSREILTGLPVIRAFNTEKREEERFDSANKDLMKANIFVNRAMSIMMPALMFIMNGIMLLIIWVGRTQSRPRYYASWRYDGIYTIYNANSNFFLNDIYNFYNASSCFCICKTY